MEALRIEIRVNPQNRTLETVWSSAGVNLREVPTSLAEAQLPELRAALGRILQQAKYELGSALRPSWAQVNAAMEKLRHAGGFLMNRLFS
jgi:hypothetical protein